MSHTCLAIAPPNYGADHTCRAKKGPKRGQNRSIVPTEPKIAAPSSATVAGCPSIPGAGRSTCPPTPVRCPEKARPQLRPRLRSASRSGRWPPLWPASCPVSGEPADHLSGRERKRSRSPPAATPRTFLRLELMAAKSRTSLRTGTPLAPELLRDKQPSDLSRKPVRD